MLNEVLSYKIQIDLMAECTGLWGKSNVNVISAKFKIFIFVLLVFNGFKTFISRQDMCFQSSTVYKHITLKWVVLLLRRTDLNCKRRQADRHRLMVTNPPLYLNLMTPKTSLSACNISTRGSQNQECLSTGV